MRWVAERGWKGEWCHWWYGDEGSEAWQGHLPDRYTRRICRGRWYLGVEGGMQGGVVRDGGIDRGGEYCVQGLLR